MRFNFILAVKTFLTIPNGIKELNEKSDKFLFYSKFYLFIKNKSFFVQEQTDPIQEEFKMNLHCRS